ncbi:MAG: VanZ family protein [Deltaproteobacteria bacterium]
MPRRKIYLALWLVWVALTFVLTSIPNPEFEVPLPWGDKLAHLAFYGVMGFFFALWRRESGASAKAALMQALLVTALVGGVDEAHQHWVPGRFADALDWLADAAGGGSGALFSAVLPRLFPFLVTE